MYTERESPCVAIIIYGWNNSTAYSFQCNANVCTSLFNPTLFLASNAVPLYLPLQSHMHTLTYIYSHVTLKQEKKKKNRIQMENIIYPWPWPCYQEHSRLLSNTNILCSVFNCFINRIDLDFRQNYDAEKNVGICGIFFVQKKFMGHFKCDEIWLNVAHQFILLTPIIYHLFLAWLLFFCLMASFHWKTLPWKTLPHEMNASWLEKWTKKP